jgi:hypothetical protein
VRRGRFTDVSDIEYADFLNIVTTQAAQARAIRPKNYDDFMTARQGASLGMGFPGGVVAMGLATEEVLNVLLRGRGLAKIAVTEDAQVSISRSPRAQCQPIIRRTPQPFKAWL